MTEQRPSRGDGGTWHCVGEGHTGALMRGQRAPGVRPWPQASGGLDTCAVPSGCCLVLLSLVYKVVGETANSGLHLASASGIPGWPSESTPIAERPRAGSCPGPAHGRDRAEGIRLLRLRQGAGAGWGPCSREPALRSLLFSSSLMFFTLSLDTLPAFLCLRLLLFFFSEVVL